MTDIMKKLCDLTVTFTSYSSWLTFANLVDCHQLQSRSDKVGTDRRLVTVTVGRYETADYNQAPTIIQKKSVNLSSYQ